MIYARRRLSYFICLVSLLAIPSFGLPVQKGPSSRGVISDSRPVRDLAAGIYFSGSYSYSIGGGLAVLMADSVTNPNGTATGPLRFSLVFSTGPYPSGAFDTADYTITASLAAGQSVGGNPTGTSVPFTVPPTGCYYVSLVLQENVSGTWTDRDYATFSHSFDIGGACIASFTASPASVSSGGASTLAWTTLGSITSVTIDNGVGSGAANGSAIVHPTVTTTYTLSAFTTANSFPPTRQVTVSVSQPAPAGTLTASPTVISLGGSSTLTWGTTNATTITIDHGVGAVAASGSMAVSPTSTTTYTLTATGPGGTITRTATVTVISPAPTASLTATPTVVAPAQACTLVWNTTNATSVSIDNGVGSQALSGSVVVHPTSTTTYTLTATGPGGTVTAQATVTVSVGPSISFAASPEIVGPGRPATLAWSTTNATSVTIDNGIGSKPTTGSVNVVLFGTTTYTLTATGPGGTSTAHATVTVVNLPSIDFRADPTSITAGGSSTLHWTVTDADTVSIDPGIGLVAATGSMNVSPSQTTTYVLIATNAAGSTSASVTVSRGSSRHRVVHH